MSEARRWPPGALDVLLAIGSTVAITITTAVAAEPTNRSSTIPAFALGAIMGVLLLFRRRRPVGVLVLSLIVVMAYNLTDFPSISPIWPLLVPLYTVARCGQMLVAAAVGAATILISVGWVLHSRVPFLEGLDGTLREATVLALVLVAATALRNKELFVNEFTARLTAERRQQNRETAQQMLEERLRIARELHDVTAHTIAVVGVQVNLAGELVDGNPGAARETLSNARRVTVDAIAELQATVRLLRADNDADDVPWHPMPDETQMPELLERAAESGLQATYEIHGDARPISPAVGLTLYRIAQESLTNVLRHAQASRVRVLLRYEPAGIGLEIVDDGRPDHPAEPGFGLAGMRERATSVGGTLAAEPEPGGGFAVRAWVPSPAAHE